MAKSITLSIMVLIPLLGVGALVGASMRPQTPRPARDAIVTIQPLEMHRAADVQKLPQLEISDLF